MDKKIVDIPLHDIKPLLDIQEYSFYYFLLLVSIGIIVVGGFGYLIYKWFNRRKKYNERKDHFKFLSMVNLDNTKKAAYDISFYGATFKDDGQRQSEMYKTLLQKLEQYKYRKTVKESFDEETLGYIDLYKGMIDV